MTSEGPVQLNMKRFKYITALLYVLLMSWELAEWVNMDIGALWISSIIFNVNRSHYCLFFYNYFVSDILDLLWGCYSRSMLISLSLHFKLSTRNWLVFHAFKNKENPSIWLFYSATFQRFSYCTLLSHRFTSLSSVSAAEASRHAW